MTKPAPYPADTRAKGWRFELDYERIDQSDTWALASPDIRPWLLMLWMTAWRQEPCGSLPNDDELIATRIGMSLKNFTKSRSKIMRGWWVADDGRLYHDTITKRVIDMLDARDSERRRKQEYRQRKDAERFGSPGGVPEMSHGTTEGQARDSGGRDATGTSTGTSTSTSTREGQEQLGGNDDDGTPNSAREAVVVDDWETDPTVFDDLKMLHGIPAEFTDQQLLEFRTYWRDRGGTSTTWNAKFIQRVVEQWDRKKRLRSVS